MILFALTSISSGVAWSAGLGESLGDGVARHGSAELALACAPMGSLLDWLGGLPGFAGQALPPGLSVLLSEDAAAKQGFDVQGTLAAAVAPATVSGWLSLPYGGSAEQAEAALTAMELRPELTSEATWALSGDKTMASLDQGELVLQVGGRPSGNLPDKALMADFPEKDGCVLWLDAPEELGATRKVGPFQAAAWFPLTRGAETVLRFKLDAPAPDVLARPTAGPVGGSSSEAPTVLLAFGVSLEDLLDDPLVAGALELEPREARRARRAFDLGPGATVALFGDPNPSELDWVAVIPTERSHRPRAIARRARRALHRLDLEVERTSATSFVARGEGTTIHAASTDGRLILGHDPMRVTEAATGSGRSWLEGAHLDRLQGWAISAWTGPGMEDFADLPPGLSADLGLRARDGIWEIGVRIEGAPDLFESLFERGGLPFPGGAGPGLQRVEPPVLP